MLAAFIHLRGVLTVKFIDNLKVTFDSFTAIILTEKASYYIFVGRACIDLLYFFALQPVPCSAEHLSHSQEEKKIKYNMNLHLWFEFK